MTQNVEKNPTNDVIEQTQKFPEKNAWDTHKSKFVGKDISTKKMGLDLLRDRESTLNVIGRLGKGWRVVMTDLVSR